MHNMLTDAPSIGIVTAVVLNGVGVVSVTFCQGGSVKPGGAVPIVSPVAAGGNVNWGGRVTTAK